MQNDKNIKYKKKKIIKKTYFLEKQKLQFYHFYSTATVNKINKIYNYVIFIGKDYFLLVYV
jgi:hypothetical protein